MRLLQLSLIALFCLPALAGCLDDGSDPLAEEGVAPGPGTKAKVGNSTVEATAVPEGEYNFTGPYSRVLNAGTLDILPPELVTIPSAIDGADIRMGLHMPDTDEPVPILLFASPYFGFLGGTNDVTDRGGAFGSLIENFVPHGYAVVGLAARGTGGSGGCNDLMGPQETADLDQAVTWMATQDWANGNVAMTGVSYDGSTPWAVASTGNPHLKTIIPISGVPDMHGLMYRNGSSESRGPLVLNALYYGGNIAAGTATPVQALERALCPDAIVGIGLSGVAGVTGADPTGWWQERNRKPHVEANYNGSIFSIQGLQDWNVDPSQVIPWVDQMDKQGIRTKQLLGQWGHAWPDGIGDDGERADLFRADYKEILLAWLDQELKGLERDTGAPVQVMDDLGRWRNEAHFPPRDAQWEVLHLATTGRLDPEGSAGQASLMLMPNLVNQQFLPDSRDNPVPIGTKADFLMPAGQNDLLISGLPKLHITVTPQGPGGYMAAYLYDRDITGGTDRLIGWTSMNLAYAAGGTEREEVIPGLPLKVNMELQPMDAVVPAGHYLALRVWVYTDGDRLPTLPPSGVSLELGHDMGTVLKLPVITRPEEAYFQPPLPESADDA